MHRVLDVLEFLHPEILEGDVELGVYLLIDGFRDADCPGLCDRLQPAAIFTPSPYTL
jgi:hypothetical protein